MMRDRRMGMRAGIVLLAWGAFYACVGGADAGEVHSFTGRVTDVSGKPISGAMITLEAAGMVPATLTVFSDDEGRYAMPAPTTPGAADETRVTCRKAGYETRQSSGVSAGKSETDCVLQPTDNVANEAAASAWLQHLPDTQARHGTILLCASCHQFPLENHRSIAASLEGLTLEEREQTWRDIIDQMRGPERFDFFPDGSPIKTFPPEVLKQMAYTMVTQEYEDMVAPFLAAHFPTSFETLSASKVEAAPLGAGAGTVVEEYALPEGSHVREVTFTQGSPYLWGVDLQKNRMLRLDLSDGSQRWYEFPAQGATGPHTIAGDADGNVWVSTQEQDSVAKFDPREDRWTRVYRFGPNSTVHDIALNSRSDVAFDRSGNIWFTLMNKNTLGRLNAETGETAEFALPVAEGLDPNLALYSTTVYGAVMTSDGRTVWFSQLNGALGAFDTEALKVVRRIPFPRGTGPRRMAIDDDDVLWVPLTGAGRLLVYDTKRGEELATYDLPDRTSHPYVAYWDRQREVVWIGTSNANVLYQFDPKAKRFVEFPLPRERAYLRKLSIVPETGGLWTSYAHFPVAQGPSMAVVLQPGDQGSSGDGLLASLGKLWRGLFR